MKYLIVFILPIWLLNISCDKVEPEWQRINMGFDENFHDIEPIDKNNIIAYSYGSGLIIKSEDQGLNWKEVYKTDSIYFEQIEFPSLHIGFICGNSNKILKTENGGNTWFEIKIDSISETAPIYGMKFITTETGYISILNRTQNGMESKIFKTKDSGITWKNIATLPEMILNIELINDELWASGNNVVLKNINKTKWEYVYKDETKEVGQIRDFLIQDEKLILSSFNGYIITIKGKEIIKKQITTNRLRSIVSYNKQKLIVAGDHNNEKGNLFESKDNGITWNVIQKDFQDIHRLKVKNGIVWGIGKKDELIKLKL